MNSHISENCGEPSPIFRLNAAIDLDHMGLNPLGDVSEENLLGVPYLLSPDLATPYSQQYNFRWELQPNRTSRLAFEKSK